LELLDNLKSWLLSTEVDEESHKFASESIEFNSIPELDSYSFVREGLWWSVLARDNWICCSCGRSPKEQGVTLEVDHIKPRSKGGTDDLNNLQTLCKKCNVGKSNRDDTNLRCNMAR
jgi:5-methylcytosine-specific restriction endonuclease McrA